MATFIVYFSRGFEICCLDTSILSGLHKQTLGHVVGQKVGSTLVMSGESLPVCTYQQCKGDMTYPTNLMSSLVAGVRQAVRQGTCPGSHSTRQVESGGSQSFSPEHTPP